MEYKMAKDDNQKVTYNHRMQVKQWDVFCPWIGKNEKRIYLVLEGREINPHTLLM